MPPAPKLLATLVLLAGLAPFGQVAMAAASGSASRDAQPAASTPGAGSFAPAVPGPAAAPPPTAATPEAAPTAAEPLAPLPAEPPTPAPSPAGSAASPGEGATPGPPAEATDEAADEPDAGDAGAPVSPEVTPAPSRPRPPSEMPAGANFDEPAEGAFLALTNDSRHATGVAALAWDHELTAYARRHARYLATSGHLEHSDIRVLLDAWSTVGENVGVGPSVSTIQDALVASPDHYRNLADPLFTHVGVGVFVDAEGRTWTAHVFGV